MSGRTYLTPLHPSRVHSLLSLVRTYGVLGVVCWVIAGTIVFGAATVMLRMLVFMTPIMAVAVGVATMLDQWYPADVPSIRLIEILPRRKGDAMKGNVQLKMRSVRLADKPKFVALSYAWDTPSPTRNIRINGRHAVVHENLFWALAYIRDICHRSNGDREKAELSRVFDRILDSRVDPCDYRHPDMQRLQGIELEDTISGWRYLWVDALCINQSDVAERNQQVNMMGQIFSAAHFVISWLGPPDRNSDEGIETLRQFGDSEVQYVLAEGHERPRDRNFRDPTVYPLRSYGAHFLLCRPYWSRLWIVQEFVLARYLFVLCGMRSVNWRRIRHVPIGYQERALVVPHKHRTEVEASTRRKLKYSGPDNHTDFFNVLLTFTENLCEDPRDKVFGLLGLSATPLKRLKADYRKTLEDVYADLLEELEPYCVRHQSYIPWELPHTIGVDFAKMSDRGMTILNRLGPLCRRRR